MPEQKKDAIQAAQYHFPYHHLVDKSSGFPRSYRVIKWALEYEIYTDRIAEIIEKEKPSTILEVGCGDGALLAKLELICGHVTGIDTDSRAVAFANAFCARASAYDIDVKNIEEQFGAVVVCEVLEHIPDVEESAFLMSVMRAVRPGGVCVISVPTVNRPVHAKHYRHYTASTLVARLAQLEGYTIENVEYSFRINKLQGLLVRLLCNKFWFVSIPALDRIIWRLTQRLSKTVTSANGAHLIVTARRAI